MRLLVVIVLSISFGATFRSANAQMETVFPALDADARAAAVAQIQQELAQGYVFPEVAEAMNAALQEHLDSGEYDAYTDYPAFAQRLTADLRAISDDLHLSVVAQPSPAAQGQPPLAPPPIAEVRQMIDRVSNFGFASVAQLAGNVGYINLTEFAPGRFPLPDGEQVFDAFMDAVMEIAANSDALILDLRTNRGGDPYTVARFMSYFFNDDRELFSIYNRPEDTTETYRTLSVEGVKQADIPVYILVSGSTFSAGEAFAYHMQAQGRATIIGETTPGGAHPTMPRPIGGYLTLSVPYARTIDAVTGTDWEAVGVSPDIETPVSDALVTAHLEALETLLENATDPMQQQMLPTMIENLEALRSAQPATPEEAASLVGHYGVHTVTLQDGYLHLYSIGLDSRLAAMETGDYATESVQRIRFDVSEDGTVNGLWVLFPGVEFYEPRTED